MDRLELVDKLREKADVSYEEAKKALEDSDWDILDAMIFLEKQGKVKGKASSYSTKGKSRESYARDRYTGYYGERANGASIVNFFKKIWRLIVKGVKWCNRNSLFVDRYGETVASLPITVFIIAVTVSVGMIIPLMIVSLFFHFSFSFGGPDISREDINDVIGKANKVAESIKNEFTSDSKYEKSRENGIYKQCDRDDQCSQSDDEDGQTDIDTEPNSEAYTEEDNEETKTEDRREGESN